MDDVRIEIQDIRTGTIAGWIEYEDGEFFTSGEQFSDIVEFYRSNGADDEYIIAALSQWNNGIYQGYIVS